MRMLSPGCRLESVMQSSPTVQPDPQGAPQGQVASDGTHSSWGHSVEELKQAQAADENLKLILDWMNDVDPDEYALFRSSMATKRY